MADPGKQQKIVKKSKELSHEQFRLKERAGTEWEDTSPGIMTGHPLVDLFTNVPKSETHKSWKGSGKKKIKKGYVPKASEVKHGKVPKTGKPKKKPKKLAPWVHKALKIKKKKTESEY